MTLHKNFVREGIPYTDRETGEQRTFNSATMPRGTSIDGRDVSFFEFSPLYVNESRKGEDYRDIPLLKGREVWLQKTVLGEDGKPVLDADGGKVRETVKVMPEQSMPESLQVQGMAAKPERMRTRPAQPLQEVWEEPVISLLWTAVPPVCGALWIPRSW